MAANCAFYSSFLKQILNGGIDLDTDTIKVALLTSSYTPALTHTAFADLTNEVSGTGYTTGGATVATVTLTTTAANSWATVWAAATAYTVGQIVRPLASPNGWLYYCAVAGTSAGSEPTWRTVFGYNNASTDNGVVWCPLGKSGTILDATDTTWSTATITARFAVLYKDGAGVGVTSPLIAWQEFASDVVSTGGTFQVTWPAGGIAVHLGYQG
jgi:hypothetical protein